MHVVKFCVLAAALFAIASSSPLLPDVEGIYESDADDVPTDLSDVESIYEGNDDDAPADLSLESLQQQGDCSPNFQWICEVYNVKTGRGIRGCECKPCPPGTTSNGRSKCGCPADTYGFRYNFNAHLTPGTCLQCPVGFSSQAGSKYIEDCKCSGSSCKCMVNTYRIGDSCSMCPDASSSLAGSTSINDCKCPAGKHMVGSSCVTCMAHATWDGTVCKCPSDMFLDQYNKCVACPKGATSLSGSVSFGDCKCPANTYLKDQSCVSCNSDSSSSPGSTSIRDCKFSACPANHYYAASFYNPGARCAPCPSGHFSSAGSRSLSDCKFPACPANKYRKDNTCVQCPTGATSSAGSVQIGDCKCPENKYRDGSNCEACPQGSSSSFGSTRCTCPTNTYYGFDYFGFSAKCISCPARKKSKAGSTSEFDCK
jgi:hypothetical protein